ncbi:MAG: hypothetical protein AAGI08_01055 [Bacteroidota bacterium]
MKNLSLAALLLVLGTNAQAQVGENVSARLLTRGKAVPTAKFFHEETDRFFMAGYVASETDLDPSDPPDSLDTNLNDSSLLAFIASSSRDGTSEWIVLLAPGDNLFSIITDLIGYRDLVIATGEINGPTNVNPLGEPVLVDPGRSQNDLFVAGYDAWNGELRWLTVFEGDGSSNLGGHLALFGDELMVTGQYSDTIDFAPGPAEDLRETTTRWKPFLAKLDPVTGGVKLVETETLKFFRSIDAIAATVEGVFIAGRDTVRLPQSQPRTGPHIHAIDPATLLPTWTSTLPVPGRIWRLAATSERVIAGGEFEGTADLPLFNGLDQTYTTRNVDVFLAAYHPQDGSYVWGFSFGSELGSDHLIDLHADDEQMYVLGTIDGTADFAPGPALDFKSNAYGTPYEGDLYLAGYRVDSGGYLGAFTLGGFGPERPMGILTTSTPKHPERRVALLARFSPPVDLDPGPFSLELNITDEDLVWVEYDRFADPSNVSREADWTPDAGGAIHLEQIYSSLNQDRIAWDIHSNSPQDIRLSLYDVLGRQVATIFRGHVASGMPKRVSWSGDLSAGTYFAVATGEHGAHTVRFNVVR